MVRTLRVRIRFRRPSLPHCGQGAFLGPQGIGITTTVGASVPMLASLVRGGLSTTTFHQGACPNVQAQNGFEPPTIRWRSSRSLRLSARNRAAAVSNLPARLAKFIVLSVLTILAGWPLAATVIEAAGVPGRMAGGFAALGLRRWAKIIQQSAAFEPEPATGKVIDPVATAPLL